MRTIARHIRNRLLAGLLLVIPLVVTYLVLRLGYNFTRTQLRPLERIPWLDFLPSSAMPWVALGIILVVLYLAGFFTSGVLGKRIATLWHRQIERVPVVSLIYRTARMATEALPIGDNGNKFNRVVLLDYPRAGIKTVGLVTARLKGPGGEPMLAVYIPTSPTPQTGYLAIVPENQVTSIDMSVEESMKFIITAGILSPDSLNAQPPRVKPPGEKQPQAPPTA